MPEIFTQTEWDNFIAARGGHLLQTWAWGELKSRFGWLARRVRVGEGAAQILFRRLPLGLSVAYVPKGPVLDWADQKQSQALLAAMHKLARQERAIFLKIEPALLMTAPEADQVETLFHQASFSSAAPIQPRTSQVLSLKGDEAAILMEMKQKTRYNIRLAQKKEVQVRVGARPDIKIFYDLACITAARDRFGVHHLEYYQTAYDLFAPDRCALLIAEFEAGPLAALLVFCQGQQAYYFYGASADQHRNLMATYLIQWAAIRWAKARGCTHYDLWGIPDAPPARLEAEFQQRRDGLWGVYRFKRGFGGEVVRSVGAYDYVYNPVLYRLYRLYRPDST